MINTIVAPRLISDLGLMYANSQSKQKRRYGLYMCKCGTEFKTMAYRINTGITKSCGCARGKSGNFTHGLRNHKLYNTYRNIKQRTMNIKQPSYADYGGRGIIVCDKWVRDFKSFYTWCMENGYKDGLSLDRIDNDGNYEPSNCRFTTNETQMRNTRLLRKNNTSGYRGVSLDSISSKWLSRICIGDGVRKRIGLFDTAILAAGAYDKYVIENGLSHPLNGV